MQGNARLTTAPDLDLERVIEQVAREHAFDVRGYKRSTLYRRLRKRMSDAECSTADCYLRLLQQDPEERGRLLNTVLINVTEFLRDPETWSYLQRECLGPMLQRRPPEEPIRAWSLGCASGEEAYSLAMCLLELVESGPPRDVKIYATDMDEDALTTARAGVFWRDSLRNVSPERLTRWFTPLSDGRCRVRPELRAHVIFGQHSALTDPPISRLDVLVCRNLLIYFDPETQQRLLPRFHYALRSDGILFLGKAEGLTPRCRLFRPVETRHRIFQPAQVERVVLHRTVDPE